MPAIKFRKAALKHQASVEQLDQLIQITSSKAWIILFAIYIILIVLVIWGFVGSIPTRVKGNGILLPRKGSLFSAVAPEGEANLVEIKAREGETVKQGEIIAISDNPTLREKIDVTATYFKQLRVDYAQLLQLGTKEVKKRKQDLQQQNQLIKQMIVEETRNLSHIIDLVNTMQDAFKEGLEKKQNLVDTTIKFYSSKNRIADLQKQLVQNEINSANFIDQWQERLRTFEIKIEDEKKEYEALEAQLLRLKIHSPTDGVVVAVEKNIGDVLKGGDTVVTIASSNDGIDAVIYISSVHTKRIQISMPALISPDTVKKEEYGSIRGKVVAVYEYPTNEREMMAILHNEDLVQQFLEAGILMPVRISLEQNKDTLSGFTWTSSDGPDYRITPGTLASAEITIYERHPISLVIPAFKKWLGVE